MVQTDGMTGTEPVQSPHPLKKLHRLLRGRYRWAVVLTLIGLIGGGVAGYKIWTPQYKTTGLIRVRPVIPTLLYKNEESGVMPMFKAFVESQTMLIQSQRVTNMAMQDEAWQEIGRGMTPEAQGEFRQQLNVRTAGGEMIQISFADPSLDATRAAVEAVIRSYMLIHGERDLEQEAQRMRILEERRTALSNQLTSIRDRITAIGNEYGSDALQSLYEFNLQELHKLESSLRQAELALASAGVEADGDSQVEAPDPADPEQMTLEELAQYDSRLRALLDRRQNVEMEVSTLAREYGDEHRILRQAHYRLDELNHAISRRAAQVRSIPMSADASIPVDATAGVTVSQLKQRIDSLRQLHESARNQTIELGRRNMEIENLKSEQEMIAQRLKDTRFRIEQLNVESAVSGRIEVVSTGDTTGAPINSGSRKQRTVLGSAGGGMLGLAVVVLLCLADRRLKHPDDVIGESGSMPLLGVLPNLPDDLSDPRQAMLAGFCVHHIRTLMQLGDEGLPRQVFVVTGPSGGSGKTSLTLSLGISFASSGAKTLLVDSDVVGGGLTRRLEAIIRRRIGQLLLQNGLLTQEQLEHGLHIARERGVMLGEALVSLGILQKSDLEHALALQEHATIGLLDAVHGEPLDHCLAGTSIPGLEILPIGGARLADASSISPAAMARIMQEARRQFDVILIDTGPVPGSIESAIACSQADRVAVVVSRGDQRQDAQRSMKFLRSIAAPICGVVFNRATVADSASSSYSASVNRGDQVVATVPGDSNGKGSDDSALSRRFGPVAHAVTRVSRRR